jgi:molecular chaperone HtpG
VADADPDLQTLIIEQIYDSALLVEGLHPDPSSMAPRVQQLIEAALNSGKRQDEKEA